MRHFKGDKKYLYWGITAFCVVAASILFYTLLKNHSGITRFLRSLAGILSPFIVGYIIAYLLLPLKKMLNYRVFVPFCRWLYQKNKKRDGHNLAGALSVFVCIVVLLAVMTALVYLIIPQLISSVRTIINNGNTYISTTTAWLERLLQNYPEIESFFLPKLSNLTNKLLDWAQTTLLPNLAASLTSGVISVVKASYNVIIGIIVSIYVLFSHEKMGAHVKKMLYGIFSVEAVKKLLSYTDFINTTFINFFIGKIIDSAIIAVLCYIGCSILRIPYALLVSAIVGVTNIVPFFGPFIGAVPSAFIILIVDPLKCLVFIIFVIVLQQLDGNIIGPKILGSSVGITGFWVMFSIILGAGLFGFWGMLLGVPVFVVLYTTITNALNAKLIRSGLPSETEEYVKLDHVEPGSLELVPRSEFPVARKSSKRKKRNTSSDTAAAPLDDRSADTTDSTNEGSAGVSSTEAPTSADCEESSK